MLSKGKVSFLDDICHMDQQYVQIGALDSSSPAVTVGRIAKLLS